MGAAVRYYREQEGTPTTYAEGVRIVRRKLGEGLITIGRPAVQDGEELYLNGEGRYHIRVLHPKRFIRVQFQDGNHTETWIRGSVDEIRRHYSQGFSGVVGVEFID
jgi:hypothetical protein